MCSVGSIVSQRPSRSILSVVTTGLPPLTVRFLLVRLSVFIPVTVTDLCGSASEFFVFARAFEKVSGRVFAGLLKLGVL
jgi:hypothetical protein